jgi:phenylalanyl-tRNA synthetase beta chain
MLVIADANGAVALAGVMGGDSSKIAPDTGAVVLEAATFDAVNVRKTAAALGLRTDAAARFEKSLDPELPGKAVDRFLTLAQGLIPGLRPISGIEDVRRAQPPAERIRLRLSRVRQLLGLDPGKAKVLEILRRLEFGVQDAGATDGDVLEVTPPSFRATKDIRIEEDLVEEIGRVFGYVNLPGRPPRAEVRPAPSGREQRLEREVKTTLAQTMGFQEVYSYSFVAAEAIETFGLKAAPHVEVRNPPSQDQSRLRRTLAPGLVRALEVNARRFREQRLFEVGRVWEPETLSLERLPSEQKLVAAIEWQGGKEGAEVLHRLKGGLETLLRQLRTGAPEFDREDTLPPWLHPGRTARVIVDGTVLGHVGELHPSLTQALHGGVALFELRIEAIGRVRQGSPTFRPIPRFPAVLRDRSWVVQESVTVAEIENRARQAGGSLLRQLNVFDIYRGASIPSGHKSLAFEIQFGAPDRTLTDQEADEALARMDQAIRELGGVPRA